MHVLKLRMKHEAVFGLSFYCVVQSCVEEDKNVLKAEPVNNVSVNHVIV